jgi:hypothetical protein
VRFLGIQFSSWKNPFQVCTWHLYVRAPIVAVLIILLIIMAMRVTHVALLGSLCCFLFVVDRWITTRCEKLRLKGMLLFFGRCVIWFPYATFFALGPGVWIDVLIDVYTPESLVPMIDWWRSSWNLPKAILCAMFLLFASTLCSRLVMLQFCGRSSFLSRAMEIIFLSIIWYIFIVLYVSGPSIDLCFIAWEDDSFLDSMINAWQCRESLAFTVVSVTTFAAAVAFRRLPGSAPC